ncbi:MAG: ATP phosphoribosyltransferase regulatory subunit [Clostridia bacterium]|nr:ATP phosphoribosyltransferase regulatory subunit [Clostridia bacterium]
MSIRKLQIPTGMQDTLPGECHQRRQLENRFREFFCLSGYQEIETPVLEFYDTLSQRPYGYPPEHVWKTFDRSGRILALRPDSTIPAARMAAGPLRSRPLPLRLCYLQSATAFESDTLSLLCEQPQAGIELMGEAGSLADAEVIGLAIDCLKAAGLREYQIELGQAAFFTAFMREGGLSETQAHEVRYLVERKDSFGIQLYLRQEDVPEDVTRRLMRLPRLYGDLSVLDEAAALTSSPACHEALDSLRTVIGLLGRQGRGAEVTIDLGMAQEAGYYSGIIFRGHAAGVGQPILSGGRYDGLPAHFGRSVPAVGFALMTKLLMIALERQGERFAPEGVDWLIACDPDSPKAVADALNEAAVRRGAGESVAMLYHIDPEAVRAQLRTGSARQALCFTDEGPVPVDKEV